MREPAPRLRVPILGEGRMSIVRVIDPSRAPIGSIFFHRVYREFDADTIGWRDGERVVMHIYEAAQPLVFRTGAGGFPDRPARREVWRVWRHPRGGWVAWVEQSPLPPAETPTNDRLLAGGLMGLIVLGVIGLFWTS